MAIHLKTIKGWFSKAVCTYVHMEESDRNDCNEIWFFVSS